MLFRSNFIEDSSNATNDAYGFPHGTTVYFVLLSCDTRGGSGGPTPRWPQRPLRHPWHPLPGTKDFIHNIWGQWKRHKKPAAPLYGNTPQSATVLCPDGLPFTYTVGAGTFVSTRNIASANRTALQYAQAFAQSSMLCLTGTPESWLCSGTAYTNTIVATGGTTGVTFSIVGGALPTGVTFAQTDGLTAALTGTPTAPGDYSFVVQATDNGGNHMSKVFKVHVLGIITTSVPDGQVGTAYSAAIATAGTFRGILSYSISAGALPAGLSISSLTGTISGTPTTAGTNAFTVAAGDLL